jgi:predicted Zn-dependent protease
MPLVRPRGAFGQLDTGDCDVTRRFGHLDKQRANTFLGQVSGMIIDRVLLAATDSLFTRELGRAGRLAFSVDFEREADYVGAYYAARAGYDLVGAGEFWRTYSLEIPNSIRADITPGDAGSLRAVTESRCRDCR